ncbi:MAG TPA: hypothetical protein VKA38_09565 [Draconibacterium sp.]|nr:hypothetical protein [Draconibacterium sp.]
MKTNAIFLFLILFAITVCANAQLAGKKFKITTEQNGTFYLLFEKNTYELIISMGDAAVKGTYKIEGKTISFIDKEGEMACPEENVGKYKFSLKNKVFKMELIEDSCTGRPNMAASPWELVEK